MDTDFEIGLAEVKNRHSDLEANVGDTELALFSESPQSSVTLSSPHSLRESQAVLLVKPPSEDGYSEVIRSPLNEVNQNEHNQHSPSPLVDRRNGVVEDKAAVWVNRLDLLHKVIWIAFFAYIGVLARVLLANASKLTNDSPRNSVLYLLGFGFFLPNIVGSAMMGCLSGTADWYKSYPALFAGLGTGFCGCCTTFATWQAKVVKAYLSDGWIQGLLMTFVTTCVSLVAFDVGKTFGRLLTRVGEKGSMKMAAVNGAKPPSNSTTTMAPVKATNGSAMEALHLYIQSNNGPSFVTAIVLLIIATVAFWVSAFTDSSNARRLWWIAVAFGPYGALARFFLGLYNVRFPEFPFFTFIPNIIGSVVNICLYIADEHAKTDLASPGYDHYRFWVMAGVSTGAMGSLSTVSTWINEISKLSVKSTYRAYRYASISVLTAQLTCLLIGAIWIAVGNNFKP